MFRDASPPSSAAGSSLEERGEASFCGELGSGGAAGQALVGGQGLGDDRVHVVVAVGGEAAGKGDAWFSVGEGLVAFSGRGTGYWESPSIAVDDEDLLAGAGCEAFREHGAGETGTDDNGVVSGPAHHHPMARRRLQGFAAGHDQGFHPPPGRVPRHGSQRLVRLVQPGAAGCLRRDRIHRFGQGGRTDRRGGRDYGVFEPAAGRGDQRPEGQAAQDLTRPPLAASCCETAGGSMDESVLTEIDGGVLRLTLNRPEKLNAFAGAMHEQLLAGLLRAGGDPAIRAVLLCGAGRGFCAGQDLADVGPAPDLGATLERSFNPIVRAIRRLPKPVVCAVHGVAAGAGANVALASDVVVAGESARFLQAFIRIGLLPDAGGTWLLPRLAGDARARGMAMLGEPVGAAQAAAWGLIWRCVPDDDLMAEAMRIARQLAGLPTEAIRLMKQAFARSGQNSLDGQLDLERDLQREAGLTPDFREGVAAFLEKRAPVFTGLPA